MIADRQDACAHNNAFWCNAVLKAAGAKTEFHNSHWIAREKSLPLYPNMVTLTASPGADVYENLETLPEGAAVKDSFDSLDLAPIGFEKLFSGTWLFRKAKTDKRPPIRPDWHKVAHGEALKKWLAAWNSNDQLHGVFSSRLLENRSIDFAAISKDGQLKAGAVFNTGPKLDGKEVVGLTNLFCRRNWRYSALQELLEPYSHKPVCTYETDDALLPVYRQLGFEDCGKLSVWLKSGT
jgi:hypothetical protein